MAGTESHSNQDVILKEFCENIERRAVIRLKNRFGYQSVIAPDRLAQECKMLTRTVCFYVLNQLDTSNVVNQTHP